MGESPQGPRPELAIVASVQCLECGTVYAKPSRGGTASANPGCPECGYVGWLAVKDRGQAPQRPRSDADQPLNRSVQWR